MVLTTHGFHQIQAASGWHLLLLNFSVLTSMSMFLMTFVTEKEVKKDIAHNKVGDKLPTGSVIYAIKGMKLPKIYQSISE